MKILLQSPIGDLKNEADKQGFNCLYYAVYHGHLSVVKLLKRGGVDYMKDAKDTSCLHIAIMRGHSHIIEFLLTQTCDNADDIET